MPNAGHLLMVEPEVGVQVVAGERHLAAADPANMADPVPQVEAPVHGLVLGDPQLVLPLQVGLHHVVLPLETIKRKKNNIYTGI